MNLLKNHSKFSNMLKKKKNTIAKEIKISELEEKEVTTIITGTISAKNKNKNGDLQYENENNANIKNGANE